MTKKELINQYRNTDAVNYSLLSKLQRDPSSALIKYESSKEQILGSIVDVLITGSLKEFEEEFHIITASRPGDKMGIWLDRYLELTNEKMFVDDMILKARADVGYNLSLKEETALVLFKKETTGFINELIIAGDKTIITREQRDIADNIYRAIKYGEFTKELFIDDTGIEILYQFPIYWKYNNIDCKCLFDMIIVDHNIRTITPYDIKTTSDNVYSFPSSFIKWNYDIQSSFYSEGLSEYINNVPELKYYNINPFKFVVCETFTKNPAIIFEPCQRDIYIAKMGGTTTKGYERPGWDQLINDYIWHKEHNYWASPRKVKEANGIIPLEIYE